MTEDHTIFVRLLDEGVDVWRPVRAQLVAKNLYKIVEQPCDRSTERWEFEPGELVVVGSVDSYDGPITAALRSASEGRSEPQT